jgi:hypothetical protein
MKYPRVLVSDVIALAELTLVYVHAVVFYKEAPASQCPEGLAAFIEANLMLTRAATLAP